MAPPVARCADCGLKLTGDRFPRSVYFARPLCQACYLAEANRPKAAAERWVLERMFAQPSVVPSEVPSRTPQAPSPKGGSR